MSFRYFLINKFRNSIGKSEHNIEIKGTLKTRYGIEELLYFKTIPRGLSLNTDFTQALQMRGYPSPMISKGGNNRLKQANLYQSVCLQNKVYNLFNIDQHETHGIRLCKEGRYLALLVMRTEKGLRLNTAIL
jgi:hypothetical protein